MDLPFPPGGGRGQRNSAEVIQTGHHHDGPLQNAVDLSEDLSQQTRVVCGQRPVEEEEGSISVDVNGGEDEGHGRVQDRQGHAENPHEAAADVSPLEKHQGPVEQTFPSQSQQDGEDGDVHAVWRCGGVCRPSRTRSC